VSAITRTPAPRPRHWFVRVRRLAAKEVGEVTTTMSSKTNTAPMHTTMARRALAGATTLACALLCACDGEFEPETADAPAPADIPADAPATLAAPAPAPALGDTFDACPDHRKIAFVGPGACVDRTGPKGTWQAVELFAADTPPLAGAGEPPLALASYCQFTWNSSEPPQPAYLGTFDDSAGLESDCEVVWGQADALTERLAPGLRATHLDHLDVVDPATLPPAPRVDVSVAVLDSAPNAVVEARSAHGESVGAMIGSVACPGAGPCPVKIRYGLVLPHIDATHVDWDFGGYYGSQGELAQAIYGAVERWRSSGESDHLVINLSVAWEPILFGGDEGDPALMPAPARAVFHALQYASCHGALIVAAAGNATGDACQDGAMAPAIWADFSAPGDAICKVYGVQNTSSSPAYPLLHAVSGIGRDDLPLHDTRVGGRPRLTAPAFLAVGGPDTQPTTPLTGTSLSAAAVTGMAALVWSYNDKLPAGAVAQRIYDTAITLKPYTTASFGPADPIRRASSCRALVGCTGLNCPACGTSAPPSTAPLRTEALAAVDELRQQGLVKTVTKTNVSNVNKCADVCGDPVDLFTAAGVQGPCAHDEVAGLQRYTSPQPEWPACPACFMSAPSATVALTLGDRYVPQPVGVSLVLADGVTAEQRFELGVLSLTNTDVTEVTLPAAQLLSPARRATLHITFATGETQSNEIPIY
jgi:hypothetical protein